MKLDLLATQRRRGGQGRDLRKRMAEASASAERASDHCPALPHHSMAASMRPACVK